MIQYFFRTVKGENLSLVQNSNFYTQNVIDGVVSIKIFTNDIDSLGKEIIIKSFMIKFLGSLLAKC